MQDIDQNRFALMIVLGESTRRALTTTPIPKP